MRRAVVDEEPVLEVLAGIREVDPETLERAARAGVGRVGVDPDDASADADGDVPHRGVAADDDVVLGEVVALVVPLLDGHDGELGPVGGDDGEDLAVLGRPGVLEHDGGPGEPAGPHEQVAVDDLAFGAGEPDAHRCRRARPRRGCRAPRRRRCGRRPRRRPGRLAPGAPLARHSSTDAVPSVTPSGRSSPTPGTRRWRASRSRAPRRSTGVNRHSSSRPVGSGKSATAYDVVRSARDWLGTSVVASCV